MDPIITQSNINTNQIFSLPIDRYPLLTDTIGKVIYKAIAEKFDKTKENDQVIEYFRTYLAPAIIELRDYHLKETIGNRNTNSLKTQLTGLSTEVGALSRIDGAKITEEKEMLIKISLNIEELLEKLQSIYFSLNRIT